ncbi:MULTISPECIES: ArsI/CadI family heavy metal resistance metalloenzyme [Paraburkholderia]|uniref:Glyoxalase/bleomycin resistance/dioxygenase family protein n=1 Tax=Paraburkholderia podalyriae TaxID=1938811 RepID=A0ABR7PYR8_9BURK|nr:ArsI/CadI family heavy metal resistance metalloenzyme [Paraburkholderia podalyriae]MBC8751398.1 glyoxalase/bleomycin resistance/dioxygenase family protein [Paraburkholderia podalyriae]
MKRFHVHVVVPKLDESVRFYSSMFGANPTVLKDDYAKWMLEDPRVNFAISARGGEAGVNHLGFQVDSEEELTALREQVVAGSVEIQDQPGAQCCYAASDKYWTQDPAGVPWETYHTLGDIPLFGADSHEKTVAGASSACCAPAVSIPAVVQRKVGCG